MPDIAICTNKACQIRSACYRYRAVPAARQNYAEFTPQDGRCKSYLPIYPHRRTRRLEEIE